MEQRHPVQSLFDHIHCIICIGMCDIRDVATGYRKAEGERVDLPAWGVEF
jgi:hypothetical protein